MNMHACCKIARLSILAFLAAATAAMAQEPNDNFADATPLDPELPVQVTANNDDATAEPGEPEHASTTANRSLWWGWLPSETMDVVIHTFGSTFDTVLAVYTGETLEELVPLDNGSSETCWGSRLESMVTINVISNMQYWIAVDGFNEDEFGFIRLTIVPTNGAFASQTLLSGLPVTSSGDNTYAVAESNTPALVTGLLPVAPLWWSWTAPKTCVMEADTRNSGIDTALGVYTGNVLNALVQVASTNDCGSDQAARVWWSAVTGQTYRIAVDGVGGALGSVLLNLREVTAPLISAVGPGNVSWGSLTGENYRVWSSTNLSSWAEATSTVATASSTSVIVTNAPPPRAFYRVERFLP